MPFLRRKVETVPGRALVAPRYASADEFNNSNLRADSRVKTHLSLELVSCEPGATLRPGLQRVTLPLANWLRVVFEYAGSNDGPWKELPEAVEAPVRVAPDGTIVDLDHDAAASELAPYRDVAVRHWKQTEAIGSDVRAAVAMPGDAVRGLKDLAGTWRDAATGLRGGDAKPQTPEDREQLRRSSNMLRQQLASNPKKLAKVRASALQAGPMLVANTRAGSMSQADFERWLALQVGSGAITEDEADVWRSEASG